MRILTVSTHETGGGAEKIARDLVQGYQKGGHESWLAVGFPDAGAQRSLALSRDRHLQPRNPAAPPPLPFEDRKRTLLQGREDMYYPASWDLFDLVPAVPDILHCHNLHGDYFDLRALPWLSRQAPTVLTLHDRWLLAGNCAHPLGCERWRTGCGDCPDTTIYPGIPADGTAANWRMKRDIFRTSRLHIAAPCRWLMDKVDESILAAGAVERRVIRQGVDTTVFAPGDKRAERALLGLPANALILLFCANGLRNNRWKDFQGLRQTLERLSERFKDRSLRLIGLGEDAPPERVGTAEVIFVPFQKDPAVVARYYRAADLYVHMAQAETYPNTVMEALCCGTPVVATAVGGIAEQVDSAVPYEGHAAGADTATGILVPPGSVDRMVEGAAALLSDPALRERLARNAAATGRQRFDMDETVRTYLDWFADIRRRPVDGETAAAAPAAGTGWLAALGGALQDGRPVSRVFGLDRGTPIDRYYIERFLAAQASCIRGRVLEVGDDAYIRRFGGADAIRFDVLHARPGNPKATIVGDLTTAGTLPTAAFDCIVFTQTLQFMTDMEAALRGLRDGMKPGGVLLTTFPGITPISRYDMDRWGDRWRLTQRAAAELFQRCFPGDRVEVFAYGNATAATAFLNGLAVEEMPLPLLDIGDLDYEVTVAVKVTRAVPPHPAGPARRHGAGIGKPPVILMYHRVADLALDPQCLAVRPERFAAHLEVLHGIGRVMPLADLVAAMTTGDVPDGAVAVTFDDGYADNLGVAAPLLEAHGVPATVFVTAGALEDDREFWWDELERTLLWPGRLPRQLFLPTRFGGIGSDFGEAAAYSLDDFTRDREWTVLAPHAPTERHAFYQRLQRVLHTTHDPRERRRLLDALIAAVDAAPPRRRASHRALTKAEVARLAAGGLIEVGAHTVNHPVLAALSLDEQEREITEGRDALERLIGRPVRLFAYPFGYADSFAKETVALVRKAGFVGACTTMPEPVAALGDPWQLPRMAVRDWTATEFERRFRQFRGDVS